MASTSSVRISRREALSGTVIRILEDMTSDWETEYPASIVPETLLVADLGFASIDIVQMAIAMEESFGVRGLPFQKLVTTSDGRYVEDIRVSELTEFLDRNLPGCE